MTATWDDYQWLTTDAGRAALADLAKCGDPPASQVPRLRKRFTAMQTHVLVEQTLLRQRATDKFAAPEPLLFTPVGLEQATDEWVARYKAARFPTGESVVDLCCGVGGDLRALAERGPAVGVDRDPLVAAFARHNTGCEVQANDVADCDVGSFGAWHIDPDRRPDGKRTTRVIDHQPGVDVIERLLLRNPQGAIKLAPAAEWPGAWSDEAEWEWISRGGQVRQLVAWFGSLAHRRGQRTATILDRNGRVVSQVSGPHEPSVIDQSPVLAWLYEPDSAVIAAGLVPALAGDLNLKQPSPGIAYLTGDHHVSHAALTAFRVLDVQPFDLKRLKRWFREGEWNCVEVKKRGADIDPAAVLRTLRQPTGRPTTVLVMPLADRVSAVIAERVGENTASA
ncbi:MAG: hypothetical protein JNM18_23175 [Planctomycetaceae bacterium]|nr:hypothetical protein [Planctomycetaceae bacterium]